MDYSPFYKAEDLRTMFNADPPSVGLDFSGITSGAPGTPLGGAPPVAVGAPIPRRILEEDGGSGDGLFDQELYGGIRAFDPRDRGWPSYDEFMQTPEVNVGAYYQGKPTSGPNPEGWARTPEQFADAYEKEVRSRSQSKPVLSGIFGRPLGKTFENWISGTGPLGAMLSMAGAGPLAGPVLGAVGEYTTGKQAHDVAMARQGIEGYYAFTLDGELITISPDSRGWLGATGNVPPGLDVGTMVKAAQKMRAAAAGETEVPEWQRKSRLVSSSVKGGGEIYPEQPGMGRVTVTPLAAPPPPQPGMGRVTVTPLAAPPPPYRPILEPVVFPAETGEFFTSERQRQENLARAQREQEADDYADASVEAEEAMGGTGFTEEDEAGMDYGYEFNTGGPVIKRRGSREAASSPLAAGSLVDRPLYDRARAQYKVNF